MLRSGTLVTSSVHLRLGVPLDELLVTSRMVVVVMSREKSLADGEPRFVSRVLQLGRVVRVEDSRGTSCLVLKDVPVRPATVSGIRVGAASDWFRPRADWRVERVEVVQQ